MTKWDTSTIKRFRLVYLRLQKLLVGAYNRTKDPEIGQMINEVGKNYQETIKVIHRADIDKNA